MTDNIAFQLLMDVGNFYYKDIKTSCFCMINKLGVNNKRT